MGFEFDNMFEFMVFDPMKEDYKEITMSNQGEELISDIMEKITRIQAMNFEPEFILMNRRNYEKLVQYKNLGNKSLIDEIFGCKIIIWDVPVDFVNIRCNAITEYASDPSNRKG